jgi:hypothetical protein
VLYFYWIDIYIMDGINNTFSHAQRIDLNAQITSISLDGNWILCLEYYWGSGYDILVYQRDDTTRNFTLVQNLNSSDYGNGFGSRGFTFDGELLAVGDDNVAHLFALQLNGLWEETLSIEQSYDEYQLSGRTLIGIAQNEAHFMNLEDCTQPMPTQVPTKALPITCQ